MNPPAYGAGSMDYANPRLEQHMLFICPECGQEHDSQQSWRRHLNHDHDYANKTFHDFDFKEINERYHECLVCRRWVANAHQAIALLQYHRFLHLPHSRTYRCRHCLGAFTRKRALCEHLYRFHSRMLARMDKPKPKSQPKPKPQRRNAAAAPKAIASSTAASVCSYTALRDPQLNPDFYLRFLCPECGKQFDRCEQWTQHIDTAHATTSTDLRMHQISGSRNHYCLQCKKLVYTSDKQRLQRHRFTHLPHKAYIKCAHCNTRKTYKTEMLRHYIIAHAVHFERHKAHVRLPDEWGGPANERLRKELEQLLLPSDVEVEEHEKGGGGSISNHQSAAPPPQSSDLIQKALLDSLIDLENETLAAGGGGGGGQLKPKSASEFALDQSLHDLEALLRGDLETTSLIQYGNANAADAGHLELDELCAAFFEAEEREMREPPMPLPQVCLLDGGVKMEHIKDEIDDEPEEDCGDTAELNSIATTLAEEVAAAVHVVGIETDDAVPGEEATEEHAASVVSAASPQRKRRKMSDSIAAKDTASPTTAATAPSKDEKSLLESHINYLCPECGAEFAQQPTWREHVFSAHNLANALETSFKLLEDQCSYLCLDCMQVQQTTRHADLQRHRFMHMPFQAYLKCTLCKKTKSSKPKMLLHLQTFHANLLTSTTTEVIERQRFKCSYCSKEFMQQSRWQNHRAQCDRRPSRQQLYVRSGSTSRINENLRLVAYLKQARVRMRQLEHVQHVDS